MINDKNLDSIKLLKQTTIALTNTLIEQQITIPYKLDLILDGGAFNGIYEYGILLYIKELEYKNKLKVNKISGCSIGALMGLIYLIDILYEDENVKLFELILKSFRNNLMLNEIPNIINHIVNTYVTDIKTINSKLYITYYDIMTIKQVVVKKYRNKEHLIEILTRSMFVPYLIDGSLQYKQKYCDGCSPYLFKKSKRKKLFISSITCFKIKNVICIKDINNIHSRAMAGIIDINHFFINGKSEMCSYTNNWTIFDHMILRFRDLMYVHILQIFKLYTFIKENIPNDIKANKCIKDIVAIVLIIYQEITRRFLI